jgi:hypothetical protein
MVGKATLEDFPKERAKATRPLRQVNMDSFSFSVNSIHGSVHAVIIVDEYSGYIWICWMKTKDETIDVIKK